MLFPRENHMNSLVYTSLSCPLLSNFHLIMWHAFAASVFLNPWPLLSRGIWAHTPRLSGADSLPLKECTVAFFYSVVNHIHSVVNWSLQ